MTGLRPLKSIAVSAPFFLLLTILLFAEVKAHVESSLPVARVTATSHLSMLFSPANVIDSSYDESHIDFWLAKPGQLGIATLELSSKSTATSIRIVNTAARGKACAGAESIEIEALREKKWTKVGTALLPEWPEPFLLTFDKPLESIEAVRINILSARCGLAGLNEVTVYGTTGTSRDFIDSAISLVFLVLFTLLLVALRPGSFLLAMCASSLFSVFFFFNVLGWNALNPLDVSWLLNLNDSAITQVGFEFFRRDTWRWPLGAFQGYSHPDLAIIAYTDSIPLLAIPAKLLSPLLPNEFQFVGLWLLICFLLQGVFGVLIAREFSNTPVHQVLFSCLLIQSPVLLRRYGHMSMCSHFTVLWGIWLVIRAYRGADIRRIIGESAVLVLCCALLHPYMWVMVLPFAMLATVIAGLKHEKSLHGIFAGGGIVAFSLLVLYIVGYVGSQTSNKMAEVGFGNYSVNLLTFLNPADMSSVLKPIPMLYETQHKSGGFGYLGLGVILLLLGCFVLCCIYPAQTRLAVRPLFWATFPASLLFLFALSHKVSFGPWLLFTIPSSEPLLDIASVFRASGRFVWPMHYLLVILPFAVLAATTRKTTLVAALLACLTVVQFADSTPLRAYTRGLSSTPERNWLLADAQWDEVLQNYDHLAVVPLTYRPTGYIELSRLAAKHGLSVNIMTRARMDGNVRNARNAELLNAVRIGDLRPDTVYVLSPDIDAKTKSVAMANSEWIEIDGFVVLLASK